MTNWTSFHTKLEFGMAIRKKSLNMTVSNPNVSATTWSYEEAFARNLGLISPDEQQQLRKCRVAIAGMGGVGGIDLVTLARLGIGNFNIADPDVFELANTNRQYGATSSTLGRSKAVVMAEVIRDINPQADVRVFTDPVGVANADEFLKHVNILVDGLDAFEINARRVLFSEARKRDIFALGAGPVGFSTVWVIFDPRGMPFDRYFDLNDSLEPLDEFVHYVVGMAPRATQRSYMDLTHLTFQERSGPSASLACNLSGGVVAAEVLKIILKRGRVYPAPFYHQFDAYLGRFLRKRLIGGNRNPIQRLKCCWLAKHLRSRAGIVA
jgi:molybdopterin/thiamine biosynthesis adenylyltransferase